MSLLPPLTPDATIPTLAREYRVLAEQAKRDRVPRDLAKAKTNFDALLAMGVITTCDDEMDRAMFYQNCQETAKCEGITHNEARERLLQSSAEFSVRRTLENWARAGETDAEQGGRVRAAKVRAPLGLRERRDGTQTTCTHKDTKKERGWMYTGRGYACCRCGVRIAVADYPDTRSEQADVALTILSKDTTWCTEQDALPPARRFHAAGYNRGLHAGEAPLPYGAPVHQVTSGSGTAC